MFSKSGQDCGGCAGRLRRLCVGGYGYKSSFGANNDNDANDDVNDDDNDGSGDTKGEMTVGDSLWFFVAAHAQPAERRRCLYQTFKWLRHKNTKTGGSCCVSQDMKETAGKEFVKLQD